MPLMATPVNIELAPKQSSFTITLPANPTTGFSWTVKSYDKEYFKLAKKEYLPSEPKRIGSGGSSLFTFDVQKVFDGKQAITLVYARPWEPQSASKQVVEVSFTKADGGSERKAINKTKN